MLARRMSVRPANSRGFFSLIAAEGSGRFAKRPSEAMGEEERLPFAATLSEERQFEIIAHLQRMDMTHMCFTVNH